MCILFFSVILSLNLKLRYKFSFVRSGWLPYPNDILNRVGLSGMVWGRSAQDIKEGAHNLLYNYMEVEIDSTDTTGRSRGYPLRCLVST